MDDGALMVDIRSESQRARHGLVPGSMFIPRNTLEWRVERIERGPPRDRDVQPGLPVEPGGRHATRLGLEATDLIGGFHTWLAAGLSVER